jgi:hypothetical protein
MRGEEISERRAIVNARRQRRRLDHPVLASEAEVAVDARDSGIVPKSKWSAVESTRRLQSARQPPHANREGNAHGMEFISPSM